MDTAISMQETQYNNGSSTYKKPFLRYLDRLWFSIIIVIFFFIVVFSPLWVQVFNSFLFIITRIITYYILNPKVLFVLTNVIVITLIGESRMSSSRSSFPASELRKEFIVRSQFCDSSSSHGNVKVEMGYQRYSKENIDRPRQDEGKRCKVSMLRDMDPLNQRADDLIARVNRQRRLEIGILHSHIGGSRL
ncbi:hypothetical protein CARUB_v10027710mg [Capsella rubella]|uniref:DUF4408 domain-containing protein n=1 Tax=Capsella rubella TaxID=81985 RepID=R0GCW9_9BRAS|nr:uncharacterized protein LOC17877125 [Capsella rubella]EOA14494.1 hypothetical protein CARUB_v10027710mg [Capsella rubella]